MSLTRQAVELPPYRATSHHLVLELAANSTVGLGEIEISDCSSQSFLRSLKTTTTTTTTTSTTSTTTPDFVTTDSYLDSLDDFTVNLREALVTTAFPEPALPTDWSIDDDTLQFFTSANVATQGLSAIHEIEELIEEIEYVERGPRLKIANANRSSSSRALCSSLMLGLLMTVLHI